MGKLTHFDDKGQATMVDVSSKEITRRTASASGRVRMHPSTLEAVRAQATPKGDPLETARLAGILAAKKTPDLIPLCHPLVLEHVDVRCTLDDEGVVLVSHVVVTGKTGAEMEALTAVNVAALTVYDMCKALDKEMVIEQVRLETKTGGKSGSYKREER